MIHSAFADEKQYSINMAVFSFQPIETIWFQNGEGFDIAFSKRLVKSVSLVGGIEYYQTRLVGIDDRPFHLPGLFFGVEKDFQLGETVAVSVSPTLGVSKAVYDGAISGMLIRIGGEVSVSKRLDSTFEISAIVGYLWYSDDDYDDENLISAMRYGIGLNF